MSVNETPMTASPAPRAVYRGEAGCVDYIPAVDTPAGTVVLFGGRPGVTKLDIAANARGALHLSGQWDLPKAAGSAFAFGAGLKWDAAATAADGQTGAAVAAAAGDEQAFCSAPEGAEASAATVRVLLK